MVNAFDPYHKWLGIPPEEQPPNHYRLLGLTRFESDPDVIESAAEGRMVLLRTRQSGPHSPDSQRLLNEVAAAQRCLLDPNQRAAYDQQLRAATQVAAPVTPQNSVPDQAGPPQTAPPRSAPPRTNAEPAARATPRSPVAAAAISPQPAALPAQSVAPVVGEPTPELRSSPVKRRRRAAAWYMNPALMGVLIAGLLFFGLLYALTRTGEEEQGEGAGDQVAVGEADGTSTGDVGSSSKQNGAGDTGGDNGATDGGTANVGTTNGGTANGETTNGGATGAATQGSTADAGGPVGDVNAGQAASAADGEDRELRSKLWNVVVAEKVASSIKDPIELQPDKSYFARKIERSGLRMIEFETTAPVDDTRWIRLETLTDPRLPEGGPGWNGDGNFVLSSFRAWAMPPGRSTWQAVTLQNPAADFSQGRMNPGDTLDKKEQSGWAVFPEVGRNHQLVVELTEPVKQGTPLRVELFFGHRSRAGYTAWLGRFRISMAPGASRPPFLTPATEVVAATTADATVDSSTDGNATPDTAIAAARKPLPDAAAVDAARPLVREAIPPPATQAADLMMEWAQRILLASSDTEDPIELYAMLSEARRAATLAGDARLAFQAIDIADQNFEVESLTARLETLNAIAERAQSPESLDSLLVASEGLALDLFQRERFDEAADLLDKTFAAFQRRDSDWHIDMSNEMRKFARRLVRAKALSQQAEKTLETAAADPDANATLGMWRVIYNNDFDSGLPYYLKGSDSTWKKLAELEAASRADPKAVGDAWWDAGQRKEKETQAAMLRRAAYWYEKALPKASTIATRQIKDRVEKIRLLPSFNIAKPSGRQVDVGEGLDLLPLVDLSADALDGQWVRRHETLETIAGQTSTARVRLPLRLEGDYSLGVEFTAPDGGGVLLALPAESRGYQVLIGANGMSGIQYIGGKATPQNRVATPARLSRGKRHSLSVRFTTDGTKGRIDIRLDKKPYLRWEGDLTALEDPELLRGSATGLSIGALAGAQIHFHTARVRLLSGSAERLRDEQPFRLAQP